MALAGIAAFPGGYIELKSILDIGGPGMVVNQVATTYLGVVGGVFAIIAVAIFPITSGDTAFRSLRLTIIDAFKIHQSIPHRLLVAVPILVIAYFMTKIDFTLIWRYFAFSNMLLSTSVLWLASKYLFNRGTFHWIVSLPAIGGTCVTVSYIMTAGVGLGLPEALAQPVGIAVGVASLIALILAHKKRASRLKRDSQ